MTEYQVILADECWRKMETYVDLCPDEIAAFGYIKPDPSGYMYVDELFLVPQEVSGAEVDFVSSGLPFAINKAAEDGRIDDLRFCIHSHVNMKAAFSGVDENMIEKVGKSGPVPWFVSAIFNKKGDTACRIDLFETGVPGLGHVRNIEVGITSEAHVELEAECLTQIEQLVKKQRKPHARKLPATTTSTTKKETKMSAHEAQMKWWEADEDDLERAFDTYEDAIKNGWEPVQFMDGYDVSFYDSNGNYKATCANIGEIGDYIDARQEVTS